MFSEVIIYLIYHFKKMNRIMNFPKTGPDNKKSVTSIGRKMAVGPKHN